MRIWAPEGQEQLRLGAGTAWGWLGHSSGRAAVWPRADEVMNNCSQVIVCQDEAESPCQLGLTEDIIHGPRCVRGIQKHGANRAFVAMNF